MLNPTQKCGLVGDILRRSCESLSLEDLGGRVLPLIDRLFDASTSLLYRFNERREMIGVGGGLVEAHLYYAEHYMSHDPMQPVQRRQEPWVLHGPRCPEWREWLDHPVHSEFATHHGVDNYLSLRLNDKEMHVPGQVGIILARTRRQPDFSEREKALWTDIRPALEALTRRSESLDERARAQPYLESMVDLSAHPRIVLDARGGLVWISERAAALLGEHRSVPDPLAKAARSLAALTAKNSEFALPLTAVAVPRRQPPPLRADLRLVRSRGGAYFIVAELDEPGIPPLLQETARRHHLTKAETQVLALIALGLSDREIGRRLFVTKATVNSHVTRILSKLGLSSRLQAALLAHGIRPEGGADRE
ncbi:MAG TPA: LuxR C-terminal-related transcriptional regulator [bacterium]|nr:LuxR C-terminal-related transcriptional regulator [bacterium]